MELRVCSKRPIDECKALPLIKLLFDTGRLKSFNPNGQQNCHEMATSILIDLAYAAMETGWLYAQGDCGPNIGLHSWLEYDGWVADFSNGKVQFVLCQEYYDQMKLCNVKRYSFDEFRILALSDEGKEELGIYDESLP